MKIGYDFDDILLVPVPSTVLSRDDVDTSVHTEWFDLKIPIISSPMLGVSSLKVILKLSQLGGLGILPRFMSEKERLDSIEFLGNSDCKFGVAVGLKKETRDTEWKVILTALMSGVKLICIDVANGYLESLCDFASEIKKEYPNVCLMAGNVVTHSGVIELYRSGVDIIRVGIGNGSVCTSRSMTGVGVPQLTAIKDCSDSWEAKESLIIADGGIRSPADAVKAFAYGADLVMLGKVIAQSLEAGNKGIYRGMASRSVQEQFEGKVKSVEGTEEILEELQPLEKIINEFMYGIKSACTYLNCPSILDLYSTERILINGH